MPSKQSRNQEQIRPNLRFKPLSVSNALYDRITFIQREFNSRTGGTKSYDKIISELLDGKSVAQIVAGSELAA